MDKNSETKRWVEFAENDYNAVVLLQNQNKPLVEIICFHCQQCAEKYLKAYTINTVGIIHKTHNLEEILKICIKNDIEFNIIRNSCIDLTDYAVETRYPYSFEVDIDDMNKAIEDMKIIRLFVKGKL